jgi:hypothetical protein
MENPKSALEVYEHLSSQIAAYDKHMSIGNPTKAPNFNMITPLMGRPSKDNFEVQLTSCIQYFLNPKGYHNQGNVFLKSFLTKLDANLLNLSDEEVTVEQEGKINGRPKEN